MLPFSDQHRYVIPPSQMENLVYNLTGGKKGSGGQAKNWADKGKKSEIITPAMLRETADSYQKPKEVLKFNWGQLILSNLVYTYTYQQYVRKFYDKMEIIIEKQVENPEFPDNDNYIGIFTHIKASDSELLEWFELNAQSTIMLSGMAYTKITYTEAQVSQRRMRGHVFLRYNSETQYTDYVYKWNDNDDSVKIVSSESLQEGDIVCSMTLDQSSTPSTSYKVIDPPYRWEEYIHDGIIATEAVPWRVELNSLTYYYVPEIDSDVNIAVSGSKQIKKLYVPPFE